MKKNSLFVDLKFLFMEFILLLWYLVMLLPIFFEIVYTNQYDEVKWNKRIDKMVKWCYKLEGETK